MKDMGMDAYRFSISWTRIFPNGTGQINQAGIDHYHSLIDALLSKGIEPYVTLHWDLPQALQNGFLNPQIIQDYATYIETCFQNFGDRVKHWITFNEPHTVATQAYDLGVHAPGSQNRMDQLGPHLMLCGMNQKQTPQKTLKQLKEPKIFSLADYPSSKKSKVGSRLPTFNKSEATLIKGSLDFVGINQYTTYYARSNAAGGVSGDDYLSDDGTFNCWLLTEDDLCLVSTFTKDGRPIGDHANSFWLYILPQGMRKLMNYIKQKYSNPPVFITENGMDDPNNQFISLQDALNEG
ncbi:unnamed protein product [Prunus armeniaca]|uniref:Beta-glucosidase n=1 Tax=Prunus armeniaca TaxID=36596 RepID=A0A6J5TQI4_PRUAR|nr:unnamed protein product [Prunus armeniaca]